MKKGVKRQLEGFIVNAETRKMSSSTAKVFDIITSRWPVNPVEVADFLGDEGNNKSLSAKYLYHFKKLKNTGLIVMKKVGNTYIAWPRHVETYRKERK